MLLDFKWYTVMNDENTIREDEAKFEDLINTKSNDITHWHKLKTAYTAVFFIFLTLSNKHPKSTQLK